MTDFPPKPGDLDPEFLEKCREFIERYDEYDGDRHKDDVREEIAVDVGLTKTESYRAVRVIRPRAQKAGIPWPFCDSDGNPLDDSSGEEPDDLVVKANLDAVEKGQIQEKDLNVILETAGVLMGKIVQHLTPDLLKDGYEQGENDHPQTGHCYVASEALYWLLGGPETDALTPVVGDIRDETHWAIRLNRPYNSDDYLDPTEGQFGGLTQEQHESMRGTGFLSREPSKRCRKLLSRVREDIAPTWQPVGHEGMFEDPTTEKAYGGSSDLEEPPESPVEGPEGPGDEDPEGEGWFVKKDYEYSRLSDTYIFQLNSYKGAPYTVPGDLIREIVRRYSNYDDNQQTINQIATEAGIPRDAFKEIKTDLGITHDSPPHTDEEFEKILEGDGSIDRMVTDDVQKAKFKWREDYDKKRYNDLKRQARKWRNAYQELMQLSNEQVERMADLAPTYEPPSLGFDPADAGPEAAMVYNLQDLHFGKQRYDSTTDIEEYKEELLISAKRGMQRALSTASVQKVYVVVGGDLSHVDTYEGTTTKGTPQDLVCNPEEIEEHCEEFMSELVDLFRQMGLIVELVPCFGNHDRRSSLGIYRWCQAFFAHAEDVVTPDDWHDRVYRRWRDHFFLFTHNDMRKKQFRKLPQIAIGEARDMVANSEFTTVFTGHLHEELAQMDDAGFKYYQAPSPSDTDRFHSKNGYVGSRDAIQGVLLFDGHPDDMIVNTSVQKPYAN